MSIKRTIVGMTLLFVLFPSVHAATLMGTAYDGLTLEPLRNAVITLSTDPAQTKVSKDGTYSFNASPGKYVLRATYREQGLLLGEAEQEIIITQEGTFTVDLILLPDLGSVPGDETPNGKGLQPLLDNSAFWGAMLVILLMVGGYGIYITRKNTEKTIIPKENPKLEKLLVEEKEKAPVPHELESDAKLDQYANEILDHLKRGGNRLTQKNVREMVSIGEAKVSLVVSELESYGMVKKIKRGRGNILILTEKGRAYTEKNPWKKPNDIGKSNDGSPSL